jgi:ArsR family transcriptional regulator, zinc-responsive transcriptional repressor
MPEPAAPSETAPAEAPCTPPPPPTQVMLEQAAALFQVIGHPVRVHVLHALASEGALTAGDLQARVGVEASALSHHLRLLRDARLVRSEPRGRHRLYELQDPHVAHIVGDALVHTAEECWPAPPHRPGQSE